MSIADKIIGWVILGVGGLCFLTLSLPLATMPIWVRKLLRYRDCYVLTATRAIVFDNEKILWARPLPFTAEELGERELTVDAQGNGKITFMDEESNLGLRSKRKERMQNTPDGGKLRAITTTTYTEKAKKAVGFLDIANVEAVDALMRQLLKLGPPAKKNVAG